MNKQDRIKELTEILNRAAKTYYSENKEIMSNFEYDALYDELVSLEEETGLVMADSPTHKVGYEVSKELVKEAHEHRMLSLDKTKEPEALRSFLGEQKGLLSWKLDGLTVVLTYEDGKLEKAVTRGNGDIGEIVTANAKTFKNLPLGIDHSGKLVIRGEAVIKYSDFERINEEIPEEGAKYKNPRNLCSGAVRQLNPKITAERNVCFYAFALEADDIDFDNSNEKKMLWLKEHGFDIVPYHVTYSADIDRTIALFEEEIKTYDIPSDGLVLLLDDIEYGRSLGTTAKFPKNAMAFKWQDEIAETKLLEIEWSPSRTGLINPIAVFEPVELEGTTVSRASLHNVSMIEDLKLGLGDRIKVYKANMIIPQIAENITKSNDIKLPSACPVCGNETSLNDENGVKTLLCTNPECPVKKLKRFANYVSRNALNIEGISEETLEKFIGKGFITDLSDIYKLVRYKDEIVSMPGFGEKSYENIIASVNSSRKTTAARLLNGLGILNVGESNAKLICRHFGNDIERISKATKDELMNIEGVGEVIADSFVGYFNDEERSNEFRKILDELELEQSAEEIGDIFNGITFVITGSLNSYENRDALKKEIEENGGKVSSSVSSKTSYLINNDINSTSGKNRDAKKLGVPIITEEEYISMKNNF